jgi:hypothetical protein
MNSKFWAHAVLSSAFVLGIPVVRGQEVPPPPPLELQPGEPGPDVAFFGERVELLGFEGVHPGKIVKGAPFSATATTERTQTLADGTVIHRSTSSALYRDGQGRSRREITFSGIGPLENAGKSRTMISIADPVTGVHYMLEPDQKVARKMVLKWHGHGELSPEKEQVFEQRIQKRMLKEEASGEVQKQSLGTQAIDGVNAEGTRITRTIPAGQIGNDRPIQVVSERWYSPDLQMVVKSTHSDPRFGTSTYTLANIQRTEPAATLFAVPSDYTVKEGGPRRVIRRFDGAPRADDAPEPPSADNEL